jgi:hypothetical protein
VPAGRAIGSKRQPGLVLGTETEMLYAQAFNILPGLE